jgi:predicted transcriptional regulator
MTRKEAAIQLAEYGLSITEAASVLGLSRAAIAKWRVRDPDFDARHRAAEDYARRWRAAWLEQLRAKYAKR